MRPNSSFTISEILVLLFVISLSGRAQQPPAEKKPAAAMTPAVRLAAAKTAFLKRAHGSATSFDVISTTIEGWGKYTLVDAPEKADIVIEVYSTEDASTTVSSSLGPNRETGQMEQSSHTTKELTIPQIRLTVSDAKTKVSLWTGTERPKHAMKKVDRENNEVEAAQRLAGRLHDFIEPPPKP